MTVFDTALGPITVIACLTVAVAVALAMASLLISLRAVRRVRARVTDLEARLAAGHSPCRTVLDIQETVKNHAQRFQEVPQQPVISQVPAPPKSGLNLSKRSHVLRMSRHGDSPEQIAASLDVPLQEVDLLLKVHRIILRNL